MGGSGHESGGDEHVIDRYKKMQFDTEMLAAYTIQARDDPRSPTVPSF
jgi:hypothetical protein